MENIFFELTLVLLLAGGIAVLISFFKQPTIVAYIITGLIVGPLGYYQLHNSEAFLGFAEIGTTLLLFLVGLELDISQLKRLGKHVVVTSMTQILITASVAIALTQLFGLSIGSAVIVGLALSFSSTIIVVKLLNEKHDEQSLYGKFAVGMLLVEDFIAVAVLIFLGSNADFTAGLMSAELWKELLITVAKAAILIWIIHWLSVHLFPRILKLIGKSQELLLLSSLAWAMGFATFVSLPQIGFSFEIGGFLAGLALASSTVHFEISNQIKSLRDFFVIIFFIILGSKFTFHGFDETLLPAIALSAFVLLFKPLVIMLLMGIQGYKSRTSFLTGISLSQVSEFSLILVALALEMEILPPAIASIVAITMIITIAISSYGIVYAEKIYSLFRDQLKYLEIGGGKAEKHFHDINLTRHVIIVGAHRLGHHIIDSLEKLELPFVVVDQNPDVADDLAARNTPVICGDINDEHIQHLAMLEKAKFVISTMPNHIENVQLAETIQLNGYKAKLILTAQDEDQALELYDKKVDYVLMPHFVGGMHMSKILKNDDIFHSLKKLKKDHMKTLSSRF